MKKYTLTFILIVLLLSLNLNGEEQEEKMSFEKIKAKFSQCIKAKKYDEAINIYEKALPELPGNFYDISFTLGQLYMRTGKIEKSLSIFEQGLKQNIVYPIWAAAPYWQPLSKYDPERFAKILEENKRLQHEKTAKTEPLFDIHTPPGFTKDKKYPLFIALHGWNETMDHLSKFWQTERLGKEFLLVFTQSSQVVSPRTFGWEDMELGKKDIKTIYDKIIAQYPVDKEKIVIAGFSQGGMLALDIAVNEIIPAAGFVVLHPGGGIPGEMNTDTAAKAGKRSLKGTIIMSEQNKSGEEIDQLQELLKNGKIDYRFIVSGSGHWYPADFSTQLAAALAHIFVRESE